MKTVSFIATTLTAVALALPGTSLAADDHKGHDHEDKQGAQHAHDAKPAHGGVVSVVKDVNYELVAKPDTMTLYITDHGNPVDTKNASATLTLLSASGKSEVKLTPAGSNMLQAKGNVQVDKGAKAVALVKTGGKPQSVRFTLK
jgi:hypothetical protein